VLDAGQLDPLGTLVTEGKADSVLNALVSGRVRGFEPKSETRDSLGNLTYDGDALGPGSYKAFVVIAALDVPPHPTVPITTATYAVRAYGVTAQNAWAVWGACVQTFHKRRGRMGSGGLGMYQTKVISGGEQDKDPDTQQPVVLGTIELIATLQSFT
jgi:hypothetical protein